MNDNNRDAAVSFLKMSSSGKVREAYATFIGPNFRHHNPYFEGSAKTLMDGMEENARQNPQKSLEIKRTISEGDLVVIHSHMRLKPGDLGVATLHIFRFEHDRIAELWDFGQPIQEHSANQYGLF